MNLRRLALRLRWDRPSAPLLKLANRIWRRHAQRVRRRRWAAAAPISPHEQPPDWSLDAVRRLWPGAANRSWLATAPQRWPALHREAAQRAAAAAVGRFDLLGSGEVSVLDGTGRVRWHEDFKAGARFPADVLYLDVPIFLPQEGTDIKQPWELSRFQHVFAMLWTDPERYGNVFVRQWEDWVQANPLARGPNWACAMDVALRAISWTAALAAWGDAWDVGLRGRYWAVLATHGHFIRGNLEWIGGARTNHYFSDIVGLAVLGAVLAPYRPALAWSAFAARELRREILRQFAPDGFDREASTAYHRLMVELATLGLLACGVAGHDLGTAVRARLAAAYRAIAMLCDADGRMPLVGDNDSGRVFPLARRDDMQVRHLLPLGATVLGIDDLATDDSPPELALLCGPSALGTYRPPEPRPSDRAASTSWLPAGAALPDGGLFVLGCTDAQMIVRCGPLTYPASGSHRHMDQLSFALSVGGRSFVVDPGQYCYTPWPQWRNSFIISHAHNTVIVDGQPQCRIFLLGRMAYSIIDEVRPACLAWTVDAGRARLVVRHSGYRRLPGGADHERTVVYDGSQRCWTVTDRLPMSGTHRVQWRLHLHPEVEAMVNDGVWLLRSGGQSVALRWTSAVPSCGRVEADWYAPAYGIKVPSRMLVFEAESRGPVEATFVLRVEERV